MALIKTSLNGPWTLHRPATGETYPATVPGVVQTDLLAAGVIERPYYRDNEQKYAWVGREDWVYAREFDLPAETFGRRRHVLVCEGLDTFAVITLNGVSFGETENMFRRYEFDVTGALRAGRNELTVAFASPQRKADEIAGALPFPIPCTEYSLTGKVTHRNLIRKCQCHGGWDWGPSFLTSGIWKDIYLASYDDLKIDYVKPVQCHDGGRVLVRTTVYVDVGAGRSLRSARGVGRAGGGYAGGTCRREGRGRGRACLGTARAVVAPRLRPADAARAAGDDRGGRAAGGGGDDPAGSAPGRTRARAGRRRGEFLFQDQRHPDLPQGLRLDPAG